MNVLLKVPLLWSKKKIFNISSGQWEQPFMRLFVRIKTQWCADSLLRAANESDRPSP